MTFGAYLNGVEGDEHGIALVRFEDDSSSSNELGEQKLMLIDQVTISPRVLPVQFRPALQDAVVQSLRAIGEANGMLVRLLADYDV